ncbi:auxiliary transport protein, membrane fusion protein family protein [Veillonellaceae bacterium DNF00626]|nr:auxiliary transport protein, membrane fusion protein family protein [Veillonellaceae bacterium DNF00626]
MREEETYMINNSKRYIVGVILIAALAISGCDKKDNPDDSTVWGQADATEVSINTKIPGRLVDLYVQEGVRVHKGDVLAQVDAREVSAMNAAAKAKISAAKAARLQAEANLDQARRDLARYEELYRAGAISRSMYENLQSKCDILAAACEQAEANVEASTEAFNQSAVNVGETVITAPFDGIVTTKYVDAGAMVSTGMPIVGLQDPSKNWVNFKVKETDLDKYKLNSEVTLYGRNKDLQVKGTIVDISQKPNFATYRATSERGDDQDIITYNVKVQVNDPRIHPGMRFRM